MTNAGVGLTGWISAAIAPLAADLAPVAGGAAVSPSGRRCRPTSPPIWSPCRVGEPPSPCRVCLAYQGSVNTAAVCAIIGMLASYAFATPPAMPCVAIAGQQRLDQRRGTAALRLWADAGGGWRSVSGSGIRLPASFCNEKQKSRGAFPGFFKLCLVLILQIYGDVGQTVGGLAL